MLCAYAATSLEHEKSFLLQDRASNVNAVGLYKDSLLMSSSNDVVQKDIETGMLQRTFRAHVRTVLSFAITNDSRMITSGYENMIVVWNLVTGSILKRISLRISDIVIES
jgi:WD40 repeat protein